MSAIGGGLADPLTNVGYQGASPERLPNETPHNIAELGRCREDGNVALPVKRAQLRIRETRRDFLGRSKCDEAILTPMGNQNRRRDGGEKRHDILRWIGVEETQKGFVR